MWILVFVKWDKTYVKKKKKKEEDKMKSLDDSNFVHEWNQNSVIILCTECVFFFLVFFCTWRTLGIRMGMKDFHYSRLH